MKKTIDGIEEQLAAIEKDARLNPMGTSYGLVKAHDEFVGRLYEEGNKIVKQAMEEFVKEFRNVTNAGLWKELSLKEKRYVGAIEKGVKKVKELRKPVAADLV